MAVQDAVSGLALEENTEINDAIGPQLLKRANCSDWTDSVILRHLESRATNLTAWNALFLEARQALSEGDSLRKRAAYLLKPKEFDNCLEDFIAELLAVCYLKQIGHEKIRFTVEGEAVTADLTSSDGEFNYVTEAKNLREILSFTSVAFGRWHKLKFEKPDAFNFGVELVSIDNPFESLTENQATAVREIVDSLPEFSRPQTIKQTLPDARNVEIQVVDGSCTMWTSGRGPISTAEVLDEYKRALMLKLMEPTRRALSQMYNKQVPEDWRRLLFVRWKPPEEVVCAGEDRALSELIAHHYRTFVSEFFPNFEIVVVSSWQTPEDAPFATWSRTSDLRSR